MKENGGYYRMLNKQYEMPKWKSTESQEKDKRMLSKQYEFSRWKSMEC